MHCTRSLTCRKRRSLYFVIAPFEAPYPHICAQMCAFFALATVYICNKLHNALQIQSSQTKRESCVVDVFFPSTLWRSADPSSSSEECFHQLNRLIDSDCPMMELGTHEQTQVTSQTEIIPQTESPATSGDTRKEE